MADKRLLTTKQEQLMPNENWNAVVMELTDNVALVLSETDGDGFIYLYPDQVAQLKAALGGEAELRAACEQVLARLGNKCDRVPMAEADTLACQLLNGAYADLQAALAKQGK